MNPIGSGLDRVGVGMLASPNPGSVLPPGAMQASPPRSTPPPPLRDRMRLKTLHTGIHKKPTRASLRGAVPVHDTLGISLKCISSLASCCTGLSEERCQVLPQKNLFCVVGKQLDCFPRRKPADFSE